MERGTDFEVSGRHKALGIGVMALAVLLFGVDFVMLRGDPVARLSVGLDPNETGVFEIVRTGEPHLVEIETRRRTSGETRGRKIKWKVVDPDGFVVREDAELLDHKRRSFVFEPEVPGPYQVFVEDNGLLMKSSWGSAVVRVTANDRRVFKRLGAWAPF